MRIWRGDKPWGYLEAGFGGYLLSKTINNDENRLPSAFEFGSHIGAAGVVTGEDFTFGKGRGGDVALLADEGARHGIAARTVGPRNSS